MRRTFLAIIYTFLALGIFAQENVEFERKSFNSKDDYEKAVQYLIQGDEYFADDLEWYNLALQNYLKADSLNPNNAELKFKIGVCYYITHEAFKALNYYKKAYALDSNVSPFLYYRMGQGHQFRLQFDRAIKNYQKFAQVYNGDNKEEWIERNEKRIKECRDSKDLIRNPMGGLVLNIKRINSEYMDHSPVITEDEKTIFFTSRRPKSEKDIDEYGRSYEDIYVAEKNDKGIWMEAKNIGTVVNTDNHDATIGVSFDGKTLYTYQGEHKGGDIFVAHKEGDTWTKPKPMPKPINSKYHEVAISFFPDGKTAYFVSDRPGGHGKKDIWETKLQADGSYSDPVPLSDVINTPYNERSVFIHKSGKIMYFSSEGHKTMGGYDIFRTEMDDEGNWMEPVNMGYPINTPGDDVTFVTSPDDKRGYFASLKLNSKGEYDIYTYIFPEKDAARNNILLKGTVLDENTNQPLPGKLIFTNDETGEEFEVYADEDGRYSTWLPKGVSHSIKVGYKDYPEVYDAVTLNRDMTKDFYLNKNAIVEVPFKGRIKDSDTKEDLTGKILLTDIETGETKEINVDDAKKGFTIYLPKDHTYSVQVLSDGYAMLSESITTSTNEEKIFWLSKKSACEPIVLKNVWFDYDKDVLRPASYPELNHLANFLKDCGDYQVEISGHTCTMGTHEYNVDLSQRRANSVVKYLTEKGVDKDIVSAKGYAFDKPLASNDTELGRQKNRRTEFRLIQKGGGPGVINNEGDKGFEESIASSTSEKAGISAANAVMANKKGLVPMGGTSLTDPIKLYFDNDEPDPKNSEVVTNLNYEESYKSYLSRIDTYKEEFSKGLTGSAKEQAVKAVEDFFTNKVKAEFSKLKELNRTLLNALKEGKTLELTIRGYASPLTSSEYNVNLSKRRVSSIINYYRQVDNGAFASYMENGKLRIIEEAFGESQASSQVSDDRQDTQNSVYNPMAAKERYVLVLAVKVK